MKIGIVGYGVVGHATAEAYRDHVDDVLVYDSDPNRSQNSLEEVLGSDLTFVCLPTPQKENSLACDLSTVNTFFASVPPEFRKANLVLRSTVPIGTTKRLAELWMMPNLVHSPEFLTARTAVEDAKNPRLNIIGWPRGCPGTSEYHDDPKFQIITDRFPNVPTYPMSSDSSEAVKLCMNGFFAVKVAYWNEVHGFLAKSGVDYEEVIEAIVAEGRVEPLHTQVPGPDGKFGFGGSCLPKDLANLCEEMWAHDEPPTVSYAAHLRNRHDRRRTV